MFYPGPAAGGARLYAGRLRCGRRQGYFCGVSSLHLPGGLEPPVRRWQSTNRQP